MSSAKKITLKSSDGDAFEVNEAVLLQSPVIKHKIEDDCVDSGIPLPNVTSKILAKVIEYCKKHAEAVNSEDKPSKNELKAWDADSVKVDRDTIFDLMLVIKHMIEEDCIDSGIRLPNVTSKIRAKVIEYCKNELKAWESDFVQWYLNTLFPEDEPSKKELKAWDADFVKVDRDTIFDLMLAAHYLNIESLLDLLSETLANMTKGMTAEEISMFFNSDGD